MFVPDTKTPTAGTTPDEANVIVVVPFVTPLDLVLSFPLSDAVPAPEFLRMNIFPSIPAAALFAELVLALTAVAAGSVIVGDPLVTLIVQSSEAKVVLLDVAR